ncbi:MAG: kelch repeat-containing protein [Rikenellaceae bacterium]
MKKILLICLFTLLSVVISTANEVEYGLIYKSLEAAKEHRTSFDLSPEGSIKLTDTLRLSFSYATKYQKPRFGYLTRMIFDEKSNLDLLINSTSTDGISMLSVVLDGNLLSNHEIKLDPQREYCWNDVTIEITPKSDSLRVDINGEKESYPLNLSTSSRAQIIFGANATPKFATSDVPQAVVKDIRLERHGQKPRLWLMKKHSGECVIDEYSKKRLVVHNPEWLIDKHTEWELTLTYKSDGCIYPVFDEQNTLHLITKDKIVSYDLLGGKQTTKQFAQPIAMKHVNYQFIYDHSSDNIKLLNINDGEYQHSTLDFESAEWNPRINIEKESFYHQCNLAISPIDSAVVQLFGYGFFRFKSLMYSYKNGNLTTTSLEEQITPRYLSSVGVVGENCYVYGGIGNPSGRQELGTHIYNDLYKIDLKENTVEQVWDLSNESTSEVATRSLLVMPHDSTKLISLFFDPLQENCQLRLREIDLLKPAVSTPVATSIPYNFNDVTSQAQLIFSQKQSTLYAITVHEQKDGAFELNLYSILYPLLPPCESSVDIASSTLRNVWFIIIGVLTASIISVILAIIRRKHMKTVIHTSRESSGKNTASDEDMLLYNREFAIKPRVRRNGIFLLDGFCVIDKENNDITNEFTPIMRQLLSLIILHTNKNNKGISNVILKDVIWFDKSESSARNNRSVNIFKLRQSLSKVGGYDLTYNNSYWRIDYLDNNGWCDYTYACSVIESLGNVESPEQRVALLTEVAQMGSLLPNQMFDFFDQFKADYANMIIDVVNNELLNSQSPTNKVALANLILLFDKVDENAVEQKCLALIEMGKHGVAKTTFDNFAKEYHTLFGAEYDSSFEDFIK